MSRRSRRIADLLHKTVVTGLVGLTFYGAGLLSLRLYHYFNVIRPARKEQLALQEKQLLSEGNSPEETPLGQTALMGHYCSYSGKSEWLWSLGKVNHVAIATNDLEKATMLYRDVFRAKVSPQVPLPEHGVTTVFVDMGNTKLELLSPLGANSPIQNFLEKNKNGGIHHICIEVDNIDAAIEHLKTQNIRCLGERPKTGAHGKPVIFLHPKDCSGVLVELEQA